MVCGGRVNSAEPRRLSALRDGGLDYVRVGVVVVVLGTGQGYLFESRLP